MRIHFTNLYGMARESVVLMAQNTSMEVAKGLGANELSIFFYDHSNEPWPSKSARFDGIIAGLTFGDVVFFQSPSWNDNEWDTAFIARLKAYQAKLVMFIHDIPPMMFAQNAFLLPTYIEMYNQAEVVIVPSEKMRNFLVENGLKVKNIIIQKMWDFTHNLELYEPKHLKKIYFPGNPTRFPEINNWNFETPLHVFSKNESEEEHHYIYEGWRHKSELLIELSKGGFGLVWETGECPEYYGMNLSYKLSCYLAAGIPVIVPETLSNIEYIKEKGLGFVVSSLEEANQVVQSCTDEQYNQMVNNIKFTSQLIKDGYFTKKVIIDSIMALG
ncbi:MAG: sugar transferase [Streptococcus sp.]|nr:sugar transferase [Streptococcus sp.]